ncbi:type II secretion system F family protein [Syntrophomonas erecta]
MEFAYRVRDRQGKILTGRLEAEDKKTVIDSLLKQNYYILSLEEIVQSGQKLELPWGFAKVPARDMIVMTRQLATMLSAGLPILKCFSILAEQANHKKLKKALFSIRDNLEEGVTVWQAMACHPAVFSSIYISMVRAGELGGVMDSVLERLSLHLEREDEITSKIRSASIYPAIITVFAFLMVIFIITVVMPGFIGMFEAAGAQMPGSTRALLAISNLIRTRWVYLLAGTVILIYGLKIIGKTRRGRYFFDNLYLHLPIIGKTISRITVARFARTMGTLVGSGIPILQALEVSEDVVGNAVVSRGIRKARESISEGQAISIPLQNTGVFEPMVIQMVAVGEETGALDDMLIRMADYFDREIMYLIDSMMALIEPILILLVGILVGAIVVSTLMPIFELVNTVII